MLLLLLLACGGPAPSVTPSAPRAPPTEEAAAPQPVEDPAITAARHAMVEDQLAGRDITDAAVLEAMRAVPRHRFMPERQWPLAYHDGAVGIGHGQTISQPYIVAFMTQALALQPGHKVLEIGTGSGYQAAVLSELGAEVYSIEIVEPLARWADGALRAAGYPVVESDAGPDALAVLAGRRGAVHLRTGDGYQGWPAHAPFDRVIVTCSPDHVPQPLLDQLAPDGRLIIPVGDGAMQHLVLVHKTAAGLRQERVLPVLFVPMTGEAERR